MKSLAAPVAAWMAVIAAVLFALAAPVKADEIRPFSIEFAQRSDVQWSLDWKQPIGPGGTRDLAVPQIPANCTFARPPVQRLANIAVIGHAEVNCVGSVEGGKIGLRELVGRSDALLRVIPLGRDVQSFRLTASNPIATIAARPDRWRVFFDYLAIGIDHILTGWDHLLFVVALVLLVVRGWAVVKAATAFTLAHSITLVASTLGYAGISQRLVEALIALSIVFLAVELLHGSKQTWTRRWPWMIAFGFGLVHGFGFAGALREIGLPEGEVPAALFAFNLGVEVGQLMVISLVLAIRWMIKHYAPRYEAQLVRLAAYGIGITASYWLVDRLLV